jgi:biopolymer transport protein TolR
MGMGFNANSSSSGGGRRRRLNADINITPLVDVMLVLLVIFMSIAPSLVNGIEVDLPQTQAKNLDTQDEPLTVSIDKNGNIYIAETMINKANLIEKLKNITKQKMDTRIFVKGDQRISYGQIIAVVGEINKAGFSKVALVTTIDTRAK